MVVPMEQWASQPIQDKSADLSVAMLSNHNEKYSDRMERSYKAFAVTFEPRFPFPLSKSIFYLKVLRTYLSKELRFLKSAPYLTWDSLRRL